MNANELKNPAAIQMCFILSRCNLGRADGSFTIYPEKGAVHSRPEGQIRG